MMIDVIEVKEHEGGGATAVVEMDNEFLQFVVERGFNSIIAQAIERLEDGDLNGRKG